MIRCALESTHLGKPFKYLAHYHITHRKFFRDTWNWKPQKLTKTQKFRESQLALKNKIWSFARFLVLSFTSTVRNVTILCALESPHLEQPFKYLGHYHIIHRNFLEPPDVEKCPKNGQKLRNFESLSWLWKTRFGLLRVFCSLASLLRCVMSRCDVRWKALV